jgi:hypothetical protein
LIINQYKDRGKQDIALYLMMVYLRAEWLQY